MGKTTTDSSEFIVTSKNNNSSSIDNKNNKKRKYNKSNYSSGPFTKRTFFDSYKAVESQYEGQYLTNVIQKPTIGDNEEILEIEDLNGNKILGAQLWYLNDIGPGTENWQRVGINVMIKHIKANLSMVYYSEKTTDLINSNAPETQICRLIYFVDQQANNSKFSDVSTLLQTRDPEGTPHTNVLSSRNVSNSSRYKVLSNDVFTVSLPTTSNCSSPSNMSLEKYISPVKNPKMKKYTQRVVYVNDADQEEINCTTNAYYLLFLSSVALATEAIDESLVPNKCMCIQGTIETSFKTMEINVRKK